MGVVRREGDWRLEKREEGFYEVTYQKEAQERILTPKYRSRGIGGAETVAIPLHRVDSYSEAEGLFEERAHGGPPLGFSSRSPMDSGGGQKPVAPDLDIEEDLEGVNLEEMAPGAIAIGLLAIGVIFLYSSGLNTGSLVFRIGAGSLLLGLIVIGWAFLITENTGEAISYLATPQSEPESTEPSSGDEVEKTPPAPEDLRNRLYFDRADQKCEWCGDHVDNPHVHHIVPRSEGGPNEPENLIVLCPNHHEKADRGAIPQSKLEAKVSRQMKNFG